MVLQAVGAGVTVTGTPVNVQLAPVPEPATWLLLLGGTAALALRRRRMG